MAIDCLSNLRIYASHAIKLYPRITGRCYSSTATTLSKHFQPLRILFCGSDEFSTASLKHLYAAHQKDPSFIRSIDVVCKQGKPSGRGLKHTRDVPIKNVAQELGLCTHEIPTFTGWAPPRYNEESISLIIAVSFGLLVPPRILDLATYGGLNVHPSLLPALRGPAPLQHTLLQDIRKTGISLQTLHPKKFDHGYIIAQDAFDLADDTLTSYSGFRDYMAERGAKLLINNLRTGAFIPPYTALQKRSSNIASEAPKLTKEDAHIDWRTWTSDYVLRAQKAMGALWSVWTYAAVNKTNGKTEQKTLRIQWHDLSIRRGPEKSSAAEPGRPLVDQHFGAVPTIDGMLLTPKAVTIEGRKKGWPGDSRKSMQYLLELSDEVQTTENGICNDKLM